MRIIPTDIDREAVDTDVPIVLLAAADLQVVPGAFPVAALNLRHHHHDLECIAHTAADAGDDAVDAALGLVDDLVVGDRERPRDVELDAVRGRVRHAAAAGRAREPPQDLEAPALQARQGGRVPQQGENDWSYRPLTREASRSFSWLMTSRHRLALAA